MQFSIRNVGIIASLVISGAMIAVAFILSGPATSSVSAQSAEELLRAYAELDTDADGLSDWQETVYGTDPKNAQSVKSGVSDAEAVRQGLVQPQFVADEGAVAEIPTDSDVAAVADDTLTTKFARTFFGDYLSGHGAEPPTSEDIATFVSDAVAELSASSGSRFSASDLTIKGGGEEALRTYAASVETVFGALGVDTDSSMLVVFADAIHTNDEKALGLVGRMGTAYERGAVAFVHVPVPAETATAHLRLGNALAHLGAIGGDMASIKEDPLRGFVGISAYQAATIELVAAIEDIGASFKDIEIAPNEPGGMFYYLTQAVTQE